jgi:hypothetical protein
LGIGSPQAASWTEFLVITSDYASFGGICAVARHAPWLASCDLEEVCADAVARYHDGHYYVVGRGGCNHLQILDPSQGYQTVRQFSLGGGRNPQDIAFAPSGVAYVSCYDTAELLKVDVEAGVVLDVISTAQFADADGLPETGWMQVVDELLYITCQRLDANNWYLPTGLSLLLVYDMAGEAWVDVDPGTPEVDGIVLTGESPYCQLELSRDRTQLRVGCNGFYGALDGGIEIVDLATLTSLGYEVTESTLGGDLIDFETIDATRAYVIVSDASFCTSVRAYDPSTGGSVSVVSAASEWAHVDLAYEGESLLYLADRSLGASGLRVFTAATGIELTSSPLPTGLPPLWIVLPIDEALVEVQPLTLSRGLALDPPWPNPANPGTSIRLRGPAGRQVPLAIYDLRGRRIRTNYVTICDNGTTHYHFDGNDDSGQAVASGVYQVIAGESASKVSTFLTIIR